MNFLNFLSGVLPVPKMMQFMRHLRIEIPELAAMYITVCNLQV
jgi:hypothetical protein